MARGPHRGEGVPVPRVGMIYGREHGAGGAEDGVPAGAVQDGVEKEHPSASSAHGLETSEIGLGVHREERLQRRGRCLRHLHAFRGPGLFQQCPEPCWGLRMIRSRIVPEAIGMGEDGNRHPTPARSGAAPPPHPEGPGGPRRSPREGAGAFATGAGPGRRRGRSRRPRRATPGDRSRSRPPSAPRRPGRRKPAARTVSTRNASGESGMPDPATAPGGAAEGARSPRRWPTGPRRPGSATRRTARRPGT